MTRLAELREKYKDSDPKVPSLPLDKRPWGDVRPGRSTTRYDFWLIYNSYLYLVERGEIVWAPRAGCEQEQVAYLEPVI